MHSKQPANNKQIVSECGENRWSAAPESKGRSRWGGGLQKVAGRADEV